MGSSSSSRLGFCSSSLASASRICQPPENSSVCRSQSSLRKPNPMQNPSDFGLNRVAVAGAEFMLQAVIAVGDVGILRAGVVEFGDAMRERLQLPLHGVEFGEHRHAFGKDGAAGKREAILRQISRSSALGDDERAVVEGVQAGENLHQRGFAGAVRAHQTDAVVGRDQPVGVFKKKFVAETFSGAGKLNHGLDSSSHKTAVPSTWYPVPGDETNQECAAARVLRFSGYLPHNSPWR